MKFNSYSSRKKEFSIYYIFSVKQNSSKIWIQFIKLKWIKKKKFPVKINKYENFKLKKKNFFLNF